MADNLTQTFLDSYLSVVRHRKNILPECLNKLSEDAYKLLSDKALPKYKSESYQRFDIDGLLSEFLPYFDPSSSPKIDPLSGHNRYFAIKTQAIQVSIFDDAVNSVKDGDMLEEGVYIGPLRGFAQSHSDLLRQYFGQIPSETGYPLSALNALFANDALVIYIPKGIKLDRPIHLLHWIGNIDTSCSISFPRVFLFAEEDASVKVLHCIHGKNRDVKTLQNAVTEINVGTGAQVEYYIIEESIPGAAIIHNIHSLQRADSKLFLNDLTVQNGRTRNNFFCDLTGEGAELHLDGIAILDGKQVVDNFTTIRHSVPNCHSDELFKYSIDDQARGVFSGLIYVAKNAQNTQAYQNNRNLLLHQNARMYSKPQLEIYADDVKCSHGLTTGQLDENGLFYLRQRGIPLQEAKTLMTIAFMADVIDKVQFPQLRERLLELIEERYRSKHSIC